MDLFAHVPLSFLQTGSPVRTEVVRGIQVETPVFIQLLLHYWVVTPVTLTI
jgi:hypothetical protein